jgi:hypothetical protein
LVDTNKIKAAGRFEITVTGVAGSGSASFIWYLTAEFPPTISGIFFKGSIKFPSIDKQIPAGKTALIQSTLFSEILGISSY